MGRILYVNGGEEQVFPADPTKGFTIDEMKRLIGADTLDFTPLADGNVMAVDDIGHAKNLEINQVATVIYQEGRRSAWAIRGTALIGSKAEIL